MRLMYAVELTINQRDNTDTMSPSV